MATKRVRLVRARKAAGYTQEEFAEAVHVDRSTVVRWEGGGSEPLPYLRPKIARLLGLSRDKLEELLANDGIAAGFVQSPPPSEWQRQERDSLPSMPSRRLSTSDAGMAALLPEEPTTGPVLVGTTFPDLSSAELWQQLVRLAGAPVELDLRVTFDIAEDGWALLRYRHELLNLSSRPLTRLSRELWFEHTQGPLKIKPVSEGTHRLAIQRTHDTTNLAKFSCLISPAIQPGETAVVGYTCEGGQFVDDHYWRQSVLRYTRQLSMRLRHRGANQLVNCTAVEEHPDGAENSVTEALVWNDQDGNVTLALTCNYLRPNQAVTLRWDVNHEPA